MSSLSRTIRIDDAGAGMTLSQPLQDAAGNVLLPAGATLTDVTLNSLRRRAIDTLDILVEVADEVADDAVALALEQERLQQRLARLFRNSGTVEATPLLMERLSTYRRIG